MVLAVFVVGLAGCRLQLGVDIAVDRAGGGLLSVLVGADEELLAQALEAGADPLGVLVAQRRALADAGWDVSVQTRDGGGRQVRLSAEFDDPDEFNALTAGLADALAAPEVRPLEPFTLVLTDDRIEVAGSGGLELTPATGTLGIHPDDATDLITQDDVLAYEVRIDLPGKLVSTTGTEQTPGVAVWNIAPGEHVEIRAVGERPGLPLLPMLVAGVVAVLAGMVASLAALSRWRRARARTGE